jgi:hypothetical protein
MIKSHGVASFGAILIVGGLLIIGSVIAQQPNLDVDGTLDGDGIILTFTIPLIIIFNRLIEL